ncbi:ATP-binding protein [Mesorhizobium sp. M1409]|uniref:AlbA family DNA-binding domain-containing protein n=1 Tax=unclassified Mesorhizobium TaxID=325217 RepID=UPI00333CF970
MEFDDIISGKEAFLQEAILLETQEGLRLDFKAPAIGKPGAAFTSLGQLTKEGRISLAKALSAFSNSAGGVLVIGLDCRKNSDGVDCASALEPLPNWKAALSAVNSAVGDLLQPKNDRIRVDGFPAHADKSRGYLAIEIPRSERRPHMCQMSGRYFRRSGSASYAMEHFDIEDAFRRVVVPELKLRIDVHKFMTSGSNRHYKIRLWLDNVSSVTAFFPSITIGDLKGIQVGWSDDRLPSVTRINEGDKVTVYGNSEFVIHPGSSRQIESFQFHAAFDGRIPVIVGDREPHMAYLAFNYRIGARDTVSREETIEIPLFPFKWS